MGKINAAIVGISGYAKTHLGHLSKLADGGVIDLYAAAVRPDDINPAGRETLKNLGTKVYTSTDELFAAEAGNLDLVCVPTGIASHESITLQALASGANVLVEKPAAGSSDAIRRMMDAEKSSGKFVAVGFQHIYAREIQFIKQYLLSGRLGDVKRIVCKGVWPRTDAYYQRNNWSGKIAAADGTPIFDSPINNAFAHYLNIELFLAGKQFGASAHAESVSGELYRARQEIETFDTCTLKFRTAEEIELVIMITHTAAVNEHPVIRVECEKGTVYWKMDTTWNIRSSEGNILYSGVTETPHADMFMDVIRRIRGENVFLCPLSVAIEHTLCIEMIAGTLTPIIPSKSVSYLEDSGQFVLRDINEIFREGFKTGKLPSEMGIVWD